MFRRFKKHQVARAGMPRRAKRKSAAYSGAQDTRLRFEPLEQRWMLNSASGTDNPLQIASLVSDPGAAVTAMATSTARQMENLDRGVVAVSEGAGTVYVGWRLLATDPSGIAFNLYRSTAGGAAAKLNTSPLTTTTDYVDTGVNIALSNSYFIRPVIGGVAMHAHFKLRGERLFQQRNTLLPQNRAVAGEPDRGRDEREILHRGQRGRRVMRNFHA